ncbi:MAG: hypothetical protein KDA81_19520 [Planctomycetaceae bacterium]|nr:hypothetical protein [Planctomycetaceae bacterium]MCA9086261.1 hypothetical protein [Planctomycetaceae bacterium]
MPSCIAPQWQWGQTGDVYHYYSEYIFLDSNDDQACYMSYWDNYDSLQGDLGFCWCDGGNDCPMCSQTLLKAQAVQPSDGKKPSPIPDERLRLLGSQALNETGYVYNTVPGSLMPSSISVALNSDSEIYLDPMTRNEVLGSGKAEILNEKLYWTMLDGGKVYFKLFEVRLEVIPKPQETRLKRHSTNVRMGFQTDAPEDPEMAKEVHPSLLEVLQTDRITGAKSKCALFKLSPRQTYVVRLASNK